MRGSAPVQRTGCLSCHARGVRCDTADPKCLSRHIFVWKEERNASRRQVFVLESTQLLTHLPFTWTGTNRERHSLHYFCQFTAPELSGTLDADLFRVRLPQATLQDAAIKHAVAALGASHEVQLRKQAARENAYTDQLYTFGLRQCNKSIQELLRPQRTKYQALMRGLTAAVVFACFENMSRNQGQAEVHVQYCYQLLEQVRQMREDGRADARDDLPVKFDTLEPLAAHYGLQDHQVLLEPSMTSDESIDVDASLVFTRLPDARAQLEKAIARLSVVVLKLEDPEERTRENMEAVSMEKAKYSAFLSRWDCAFSEFLIREQGRAVGTTSNGCRLLQAHHLAASILADVKLHDGEHGWAIFTPRYQKIVELLDAVTQTLPKRAVTLNVPQDHYYSASMGLTEPLYSAATRCADPVVAKRARVLLDKLPSNEGAHSSFRIQFIEKILCTATGRQDAVESSGIST